MLVDSNTERFLSADRPEIYGRQTAFCFLSDPPIAAVIDSIAYRSGARRRQEYQ